MRTRRVQDKAWAIDLHFVKHSGMGKAAAVLGGEKVDWWATILMFSLFSFLQNTFSNKFGGGWASFRHEDGCFLGGLAMLALQTARCWAEDGCL